MGRGGKKRAAARRKHSLNSNACMDYTPVEDIKTYETVLLRPADVAQALMPAVSRLVSTLFRGRDTVPKAGVGMSADAAGRSACATSGEKSVLSRNALYFGATTSSTSTTSNR